MRPAQETTEMSETETGAILEARALVHRYRQGRKDLLALRDVDLAVGRGEFLAVTGPSGSGKSTLLHVLGGILRPDGGEVWFEGRALSALSDNELTLYRRRRLGFVFQFFHLLPTMSALENVAVPLMLDGVPDALDRARAALGRVGLAERFDHRPAELSGGEQQRVAVARAVVTEPAVLCADEPTGNLDSVTGEDVLKILRAMADAGQTVVLVTHEARVAAFADRVVRLVDGTLVGPGGERA
jgi:putative ABC transport system ATP-binding protein